MGFICHISHQKGKWQQWRNVVVSNMRSVSSSSSCASSVSSNVGSSSKSVPLKNSRAAFPRKRRFLQECPREVAPSPRCDARLFSTSLQACRTHFAMRRFMVPRRRSSTALSPAHGFGKEFHELLFEVVLEGLLVRDVCKFQLRCVATWYEEHVALWMSSTDQFHQGSLPVDRTTIPPNARILVFWCVSCVLVTTVEIVRFRLSSAPMKRTRPSFSVSPSHPRPNSFAAVSSMLMMREGCTLHSVT